MRKHYFISALALFTSLANLSFSQTGSQIFTTSGTFTVPAGVTSVTIEVVGAGGNGGYNGTGGGGGGGYAMGTYPVTPLSTFPVNIGVNGGGSAGTTIVGSYIQATGGENGVSVANPTVGGGGSGGFGIAGTVNYTGGNGGGGYYTYFGGGGGGAAGATGNGSNGGNSIAYTPGACLTPGGSGGTGGGAPGGDGGKGAGFTDNSCSVSDPSAGGVNYGGGGGGGNGISYPPGVGANGYCKITWGTTGIADLNMNSIIISQNPFVDKIIVGNTTGDEVYELINAQGQVVWNGKNISDKDFSDLASELYILKVQTKNAVQVHKIIKQKR